MKNIKCCLPKGRDDPEMCQDLGFCDLRYPIDPNNDIYEQIANENANIKPVSNFILLMIALAFVIVLIRFALGL
jgi:hypothetical protein